MPPRPQDAENRAAAVRRVLSFIKHTPEPILGLAPEGGDNLDGKLVMPAPGAGRFGLMLADCGLRFIPVGAYETDGVFCLKFGPGYDLKIPPGLTAREKDTRAARFIMQSIANLLPEHLQGDFNLP